MFRRLAHTLIALSFATILVGIAPTAAGYGDKAFADETYFSDGFYIGLGFGYAHVIGERGVNLEPRGGCSQNGGAGLTFMYHNPEISSGACVFGNPETFEESIRTDAGSGFGFELRFGYNILGYVSLEISLAGNGTFNTENGIGYPTGQVRLHPVNFFIPFRERFWDVSLFVGAGYAISGYQPDPAIQGNDDQKGWEGLAISGGIGVSFAPVPFFSIDLDLRIVAPQYFSFLVDWEDGTRTAPVETPSQIIIAPTLQFTFRVPTAEE